MSDQRPLPDAELDAKRRSDAVAAQASRVLGDPMKAQWWLRSENRILGAPPIDLLGTRAGMQAVLDELGRIESGDFV